MSLFEPDHNLSGISKPGFRGFGSLVLAVMIMFIHAAIYGQESQLPNFKQHLFTTANGICNNNIRNIVKDKTGYLWIGTANGLSRFDGHYFTNFIHNHADSNSLGHNFIQGIICDKNGRIWVLHILGISLFNPEKEDFSNFPVKGAYPHFSGGFTSFTEDYAGNLWLGNQKGLAIFSTLENQYLDAQELKTFLFSGDDLLVGSGIFGIAKGEKGKVWLNTQNRIFKWDPVHKMKLVTDKIPIQGLNSGLAINYEDTSKSVLYSGTFNRGLLRYDYKNDQWEQYSSGVEALSTSTYDPVRCLQPYNKVLDAYISELGIGFFNKEGGKLVSLAPVPFSHEKIMQVLFADNDNLWAGTDNGLFLLSRETLIPENITPINRNMGAFNTIQVQTDRPFLYSGNYGVPAVYGMPANGGSKADLKGVTGYLRYYYKSSKGAEWLSTEEAVFLRENGNGTWNKVPLQMNNKASPVWLTRNFAEDINGDIWLRIRNGGVCRYNPLNKTFVQFDGTGLPANGIFSGLVYVAFTKTLWLSEESTGLYALSSNSDKWQHHPLQLGHTPLTPAKLVAGKRGNLAFPDPYNGIGIYTPETRKIRMVSQQDGLLSNFVSSLEADSAGNLWTFSAEGISRVMIKDYSVANFKHPDFIKIQEIACGGDGMVYIAAAEGLYRFNGNWLLPKSSRGKLQVNKVEVMGKPILFEGRDISLPPDMSDIMVHFSYIDFYLDREPSFQYRFEGETEWKNLGNQNRLSFSRLSPGTYILSIREKNDDDPQRWKKLTWHIDKPLWQRNWFILAMLMVAGAFLYLFTQRRISSVREKAALKQKMAETEMAALQAQMNPHFIFNSINCIDAMVQEGDKYNATTYLNKFAKLLRNVLEGSRNTTVSLSSDLETLKLYIELECMRMDENFDWKIDISEEVYRADIRVPSLIIQPYVENAILHGLRHLSGKKGNLYVGVDLQGEVLTYRITDNGIGRELAKTIQKTQHNSFGLEITKSRIEHFNLANRGNVVIKDLSDNTGAAAGTEVLVNLPLN